MSTSSSDDSLPRVRGKRGRYHHGDLRQALLDAALVVLARQGPKALTLREVARRAGVTHAAPYRHFADKDALLAALAEQGFRRLSELMREAEAIAGNDPLQRLLAAGEGYGRFASLHREHFLLMFSPLISDRSRYPDLAEAGEQAFSVLLDAVTDAQKAGVLRPGDPRNWALAAWAGVHGASVLLINGQLQATGLAEPGDAPAGTSEQGDETLAARISRFVGDTLVRGMAQLPFSGR